MMKEKILNQLQNFSKGMFVPVLILPIAGIIIAIGNILTNAKLAEYLPFLKEWNGIWIRKNVIWFISFNFN